MPDLWLILSWLYHGLIQYILFWVPLLTPFPEDEWPPGEWWWHNTWEDWFEHRDAQWRPDEHLIQRWWVMIVGESKRLFLTEAEEYVDYVRDGLSGLIGWVHWDFANLGDWINAVNDRVGWTVPWWVTNLGNAVDWLRDRLPESIREGREGWDGLLEWVQDEVRTWAKTRFDYAKEVAFWARDWVVDKGQGIETWWDERHYWLDWFVEDAYAALVSILGEMQDWIEDWRNNGPDRVVGWLGPDFPRLLTFSRDCVDFYYNLWSLGWSELVALVTDPRAWVLSRVERAIADRW